MIHIAIYESNPIDMNRILSLIADYKTRHSKHSFSVSPFNDPSYLLSEACDLTHYSIFILNPEPSPSDIELGPFIRCHSKNASIIYTSTHKEYAFEAFEVFASRYLLKPLIAEEFFEALDCSLIQSAVKKDRTLTLKCSHGLIAIPFKEIMYTESFSRTVMVHKNNESVSRSMLIRKSYEDEIAPLLSDHAFVQTHKSFVINLEYIERIQSDKVVMKNGDTIAIAQRRKLEVKQRYLEFSQRKICHQS